jgi:hypothetical protein
VEAPSKTTGHGKTRSTNQLIAIVTLPLEDQPRCEENSSQMLYGLTDNNGLMSVDMCPWRGVCRMRTATISCELQRPAVRPAK